MTTAYPPCTCATGECERSSHRPMSAQCGHPGVYGHRHGRSHCIRWECRAAADLARPFPSQRHIGRAIAKLTGVTGAKGGWIYSTTGTPICQGWADYAAGVVGVVKHIPGTPGYSVFDFEPGKGWTIREEGLRRLAARLQRLAARERSAR